MCRGKKNIFLNITMGIKKKNKRRQKREVQKRTENKDGVEILTPSAVLH